jgi:L-alanine-DL-glutamate epimerase-like enolase superfamily enzyme
MPLQIKDGYAIVPRRPGHGVEFDWSNLDKMKA